MKTERTYQGLSYNTYRVTLENNSERAMTDAQLIKAIDSQNYFGGHVEKGPTPDVKIVRVYTD